MNEFGMDYCRDDAVAAGTDRRPRLIPKREDIVSQPFTYWSVDPTPIFGESRWAIGQWGPRAIVQTDEETARLIVAALNAQKEEK